MVITTTWDLGKLVLLCAISVVSIFLPIKFCLAIACGTQICLVEHVNLPSAHRALQPSVSAKTAKILSINENPDKFCRMDYHRVLFLDYLRVRFVDLAEILTHEEWKIMRESEPDMVVRCNMFGCHIKS
jgi:hypothetical protein